MEKQKHGGPAFPNSKQVGDVQIKEVGITLRDYFAAKAMQAVISNSNVKNVKNEDIASAAYKMAEAMLAERNEEQDKC